MSASPPNQQSRIYEQEDLSCPEIEGDFESSLDISAVNDNSPTNTIVTHVIQSVNAIDSKTGLSLFNITKSEYSPHFTGKYIEPKKLLAYQDFI